MSLFTRRKRARGDVGATPPLEAAGKLWRWQQGDVVGQLVDTVPTGVKLHVKRDGVLAHGETTGHAHRLAEASGGLLYEAEDGTLYVKVGPKGATITHEEHGPVTLPPESVYQVGRVAEYDHFQEEARQVRD